MTGFLSFPRLVLSCAVVSIGLLHAQITLNPNPTRALGHASVTPKSTAPNLVEGREFNAPRAVAIDASVTPPILYVSDFWNNRVLAWRDLSKAKEGAFADLVIGQRDKLSTNVWGPGTTFRSGLSAPTGLAVDGQGNLYVVDTGNNRILRFPKPFEQPEDALTPDFIIGQTTLNTDTANLGGISASSIAVNVRGCEFVSVGLAFDSRGNLYFTDTCNHRVLRYPAVALAPGSPNAPAADLVLGQTDMFTVTAPPARPADWQAFTNTNVLRMPGGLALSATHLYVSDYWGRVLIYPFPNFSGQAASRIMGALPRITGQPAPPAVNETEFGFPAGIVLVGAAPAICDFLHNRILIFDPVDKWPLESERISPQAKAVIGQGGDLYARKAATSATGLIAPVHAVFFNNELYVADAGNHRVAVFPQQSASPPTFTAASRVVGQLALDFGSVNLIEGRELFIYSASAGGRGGVAVDTRSDPPRLYVADTYNNRVLGFKDARRVKTGDRADLVIGQDSLWRSEMNFPFRLPDSRGASGLLLPTGIVVDANGDLFVADSGNGRVLRFPKPFSQSGMPSANLVLGQRDSSSKLTDPSPSNMAAPYALALTVNGHLLVSDSAHNRVLMFRRPAGGDFTNGMAASAKIGQPDFFSVAPGQASGGVPAPMTRLNGPRGIALDSSDRLYVCDTGNSRLQIFPPISALGATDDPSAAVALSGLRNPYGVFVSQTTGEIWVANTVANQSLRYPHYDLLPVNNYRSDFTIPGAGPLALTQDSLGNLLVADATNRVAIHYPAMSPVNAASYLPTTVRALAPGMHASLFPAPNIKFGSETKVFNELPNPVPLPRTLADIQVLFNDEPAPLVFVSPGQINFVTPMLAPTSGTAELVVQQASTGQVLASITAPMGPASPALFTANATGRGLVAALNQDNSVNSPTAPATRGEVIQLFCTGQGFVENAPPDGDVSQGLRPTPERPRVFIEPDYVPDDHIQYSGLAPGLISVWQINVKIPANTAPGNRALFIQYKSLPSSPPGTPLGTTISVK